MGRMLRIEGLVESSANTEPDKLDLSSYPLEDLESLRDTITKEIERRLAKTKGQAEIDWEGYWDGNFDTKKPYLAVLKPHFTDGNIPERRYQFEFLKCNRILEKDGKVRFNFYGFLPIGTVLRGRVVIGEEYYYKVVPAGLKKISEIDAVRAIVKLKEEMRNAKNAKKEAS